MLDKAYTTWKTRIADVPPHVIITIAVILSLLVIGVVIQIARGMDTPDINSPNVFAQVPTGLPLKSVSANEVIGYLKSHKVTVGEVRPYTSSQLKPVQAFAFGSQGQTVVILTYTDTNTMLVDRRLFTANTQSLPAVSRSGAAATAPPPRPTGSIAGRWNVDGVGNVLLLTEKTMAPGLRSDLVSHLYSLVVAPVRPAYPTPTP